MKCAFGIDSAGLDLHFISVTENDIPVELKGLAERMGKSALLQRINKEQQLIASVGHHQNRGFFSLAKHFDLNKCIKTCLKLCGLWRRAFRNYLDIQVVRNEVFLDRLPAGFDGFRLLQLTDLHADLHPEFAGVVRQVIESVSCDMIAVTGDFRTCTFGDHTGATEASIEILKDLPVPCYATLGNHDFLIKVPALEAAGVRFLINESAVMRRGAHALHFVGIDDPNFYKTHLFEHAIQGIPSNECKVLFSHSPETYLEAASYGFDFQISGHTHGGQICLPGGRVVVHDGSSPRHLLGGRWKEGRLQGYTSRGTGASGVPARLNCPAEVTLHILRASKAPEFG